jgi:hypothetical protein
MYTSRAASKETIQTITVAAATHEMMLCHPHAKEMSFTRKYEKGIVQLFVMQPNLAFITRLLVCVASEGTRSCAGEKRLRGKYISRRCSIFH